MPSLNLQKTANFWRVLKRRKLVVSATHVYFETAEATPAERRRNNMNF